ncbi:AEC family transporter [Telmatospirillum siberiense]|uniref:Permease n=1 Tax=Telmatospirillum siberiense TaxID=382514 RepID=A0A2N3PMR3_9PROT|nr:AEC family transporter [Telmatospirillum siberiense]PKU21695.1 permease [Telmatospirillum siberiense]
MFSVLSITAPIFIVILLGYVSTWKNITTKADVRALGVFVIKFALPALIFRSLSQRSLSEIVNFDYLLACATGSLSVFLSMFAFARIVRKKNMAVSAMHALGSSVSNSGFIGYPIAMLVLGPAVVVALALTMIIENIVMIPLALVLAECSGQEGKSIREVLLPIAKKMALNPLILAILLGGAVSLSGITLPVPISKPIDMLAAASGVVALFAVGGVLVGLRVGGMVADIGRIVGTKLILHPTAIFLALFLVPRLDPDLRKAMVILASAPMLSIYPLLGQAFGQEQVCAAALMVATTFSFLTISGLLLLL